MNEIKIEYLPIEALTPYEKNTRAHSSEDVKKIALSIQKYGMNDPIGIWGEKNIIVEGHGRMMACLRLGIETVPVIRLDHLDDEQRREYAIMHNKTAELSEWNAETLAQELKCLDLSDFDIDWDLPELIEPEEEAQEDGYEPMPPQEPLAKRGQVWQLGRHRLMCGSSTDTADVEKLMNGQQADLLLTDPPYGVEYEGSTGMTIENDDMRGEEFIRFLTDAFEAADAVMKPGAAFYIWHADGKGYEFNNATHNVGWHVRQVIIWVKNALVLGRQDYQWKHEPCLYGWKEGAGHYFTKCRTLTTTQEDEPIDLDNMKKEDMKALLEKILDLPATAIEENKPKKNDVHPTMKPIRLMGKLIQNSTRPGEIVLDSFGGSGSTLIAAEQLNRTCYMMELDPKYVDVIIDRWETLTGEQAELLEG